MFTVLEIAESMNGCTAATIAWSTAVISSADTNDGGSAALAVDGSFVEAVQILVQPVSVILYSILLQLSRHALIARIGPRERRLDAVARVVGEREGDRARRRNRQQVAVADAVLPDPPT